MFFKYKPTASLDSFPQDVIGHQLSILMTLQTSSKMPMTCCLFRLFSSFGVEQCFGNYHHPGLMATGFWRVLEICYTWSHLTEECRFQFGELQYEERQNHGLPLLISGGAISGYVTLVSTTPQMSLGPVVHVRNGHFRKEFPEPTSKVVLLNYYMFTSEILYLWILSKHILFLSFSISIWFMCGSPHMGNKMREEKYPFIQKNNHRNSLHPIQKRLITSKELRGQVTMFFQGYLRRPVWECVSFFKSRCIHLVEVFIL